MAIDSAAKRCSALAARRLPWFRRFGPIPDGTVSQEDRQQVWFVYNGIAATAIVSVYGPICFEAVQVTIPYVEAVQTGCP